VDTGGNRAVESCTLLAPAQLSRRRNLVALLLLPAVQPIHSGKPGCHDFRHLHVRPPKNLAHQDSRANVSSSTTPSHSLRRVYLLFRCDADPSALADYILALLKHNAPESELRKDLTAQLEEFLEKGASLVIPFYYFLNSLRA